MKKHWKRWLSLLLLLLLIVLAWLLWPDRRLAQARSLQKELAGPQGRAMSAEQRREKWQQYRQLTKNLTPAQRNQLSAESRKRRQQEMARYFKMSPAEKTRYLDERIRAGEKMRQQNQARNGQNGGGNGPRGGSTNGGGPPGNRDRSPAGRDQGRQDRLDNTSPAERAMFAQFMKDLNNRRTQLGMPQGGRGFGPPR